MSDRPADTELCGFARCGREWRRRKDLELLHPAFRTDRLQRTMERCMQHGPQGLGTSLLR
jgi:hypothetical protein